MKYTRRNKQKTEKGITLLSLIVSIIILVILASVLINISLDNEKIVSTTIDGATLYEIEQYEATIEEGMEKQIVEESLIRTRS